MEKPEILSNPDFEELMELCQTSLDEIVENGELDSDTKEYIYEAAMEAVFGKAVWDYINNKLL